MKATQVLHNVGQSIWLDNITRDLLDTGTLVRYIDQFSVTGLTSNPTIFDHAIKNSMPEGTLKAFAEHGEIGSVLPADGGDCEEVLAAFAKSGIDVDVLAARLQDDGAKSFVSSWNELLAVIAANDDTLKSATASCTVHPGTPHHQSKNRNDIPVESQLVG
jgi:transaldolase